MWIRVLEVWLTTRLLESPAFHRGVRSVHKKVHELKHGKDPSSMGGTNIEVPGPPTSQRFLNHYMDELKNQFRGEKK